MDGEITKIITRRMIFNNFFITTNSIQSNYDGKWSNCLYLHFKKEDFPKIKYPSKIKNDSPFWKNIKYRFDYLETELNELEFHGGITFYEEIFHLESEATLVKVGCDYQHLYDDEYRMSDSGEIILRQDGVLIAERFKNLISRGKEDVIK